MVFFANSSVTGFSLMVFLDLDLFVLARGYVYDKNTSVSHSNSEHLLNAVNVNVNTQDKVVPEDKNGN